MKKIMIISQMIFLGIMIGIIIGGMVEKSVQKSSKKLQIAICENSEGKVWSVPYISEKPNKKEEIELCKYYQ